MARVLISHDEPVMQMLLTEWCQEEGHEVVATLADVPEALSVLRTTPLPVVAILERITVLCIPVPHYMPPCTSTPNATEGTATLPCTPGF